MCWRIRADAASILKDLRAQYGLKVCIDDFGSGMDGLQRLQLARPDIVKIDGSLVRNLQNRPQSRIFLRRLLGLINSLGLTTVAECVETAEDAALLRAEGIGYLQGYHFGQPTVGTCAS